MSEPAVGERINSLPKFLAYLGKASNVSIKQLSGIMNMPTAIPNDNTFWLWRETWRMYAQVYEALEYEIPYPRRFNPVHQHFLHLSRESPQFVAYTPDETYGKADRQVKTTIGKYLRRYYPEMDDAFIKQVTDLHKYHYDINSVLWARTADEFEQVYLNGPSSCMSHNFCSGKHDYLLNVHPSRLFAFDPRVALAYMLKGERITARCLTMSFSEAEKYFIKVYGDNVLGSKLKKLGFVAGCLAGAKLELVPARTWDDREVANTWICPYIDDPVGSVARHVMLKPDHLLITADAASNTRKVYAPSATGMIGTNQGMMMNPTPGYHPRTGRPATIFVACSYCGDEYEARSLTYSPFHDQRYCEECLENNFTDDVVYNVMGDTCAVHNDECIEIFGTGNFILNRSEVYGPSGYVLAQNYLRHDILIRFRDLIKLHDGTETTCELVKVDVFGRTWWPEEMYNVPIDGINSDLGIPSFHDIHYDPERDMLSLFVHKPLLFQDILLPEFYKRQAETNVKNLIKFQHPTVLLNRAMYPDGFMRALTSAFLLYANRKEHTDVQQHAI